MATERSNVKMIEGLVENDNADQLVLLLGKYPLQEGDAVMSYTYHNQRGMES